MNRFHNKKRGFTLIDVMVVMAIVSLLSSMSIASLTTARTKAVTAKKTAEVRNVQTAFNSAAISTTGNLIPPLPADDSYYCLGKSAEEGCSFLNFPNLKGNDNLKSFVGDINHFVFDDPILIDSNLPEFTGAVYQCTNANDGVCTEAAIYWSQIGNAPCPFGIQVFTGTHGIVCGQNAGEQETDQVEVAVEPGGCVATSEFPENCCDAYVVRANLQYGYDFAAIFYDVVCSAEGNGYGWFADYSAHGQNFNGFNSSGEVEYCFSLRDVLIGGAPPDPTDPSTDPAGGYISGPPACTIS